MKVLKYILMFILFSLSKDILALDEELDESKYGGITKQRQAAIYFATARKKHLSFDFKGAIEYYTKILELYPDSSAIFVYRGNAKSALRDYNNAVVDYNKAIELNMDSHSTYLERGRTRISAGQMDEGCRDLIKADQLGNIESIRYINKFCN